VAQHHAYHERPAGRPPRTGWLCYPCGPDRGWYPPNAPRRSGPRCSPSLPGRRLSWPTCLRARRGLQGGTSVRAGGMTWGPDWRKHATIGANKERCTDFDAKRQFLVDHIEKVKGYLLSGQSHDCRVCSRWAKAGPLDHGEHVAIPHRGPYCPGHGAQAAKGPKEIWRSARKIAARLARDGSRHHSSVYRPRRRLTHHSPTTRPQ